MIKKKTNHKLLFKKNKWFFNAFTKRNWSFIYFFKNRNIYIWCMLRKKKYLFIASFPFNTLCTLLREYKTPVPHLKADKRIIAQQEKTTMLTFHIVTFKKKKKFIHPCNIFLLKCPQLTWWSSLICSFKLPQGKNILII